MTFEEVAYELSQGVVTVIYGNNRDRSEGRSKSNGSGKSALLEAIAAGYTGSPLRRIKNGELVQNGRRSATVELELYNEQVREELRIERVFYPRKSAQVRVFINGEPKGDLTSAGEANAFITERVGIGHEDLYNYFILSRSRFESFLDASDTKKKEVINRFSNGMLVDTAVEELELDIRSARERVTLSETRYNQLLGKVEGIRESIEEALRDREQGQGTDRKAALREKLEEAREALAGSEQELSEREAQLQEVSQRLSRLEGDGRIAKLKKAKEATNLKILKTEEEVADLREELSETRLAIRELRFKLENTATCPRCEHTFSLADGELDMERARQELEDLEADEEDILAETREARQQLAGYQEKAEEIAGKLGELEAARGAAHEKVFRLRSVVSGLEGQVQRHRSLIQSLEDQLQAWQPQERRDLVTPLRGKLSVLEPQLAEQERRLGEEKAELDRLVEQKDVFRRFKTHLANKSIATIERIANDYLEAIGSDITLRLDAETELSSGKTREKISAMLYRDGQELGSFNKNSNGEKAEVNLATILTMHRMINLSAGEGKGLDLLVIDEILDAADATGLMQMIRAMNRLGMTVLMVSHGALDANYEHTVVVEKERGKSQLIREEVL